MTSYEWALIQYDWCPYEKRRFGHRQAQGKDHRKTERRRPSMSQGEKPQEDNLGDTVISDFGTRAL